MPVVALRILRPPLWLPIIRDLLHASAPLALQCGTHVLAPHPDWHMPRHSRRSLLPLVVEGPGLGLVHTPEHLLCFFLLGESVALLDHLPPPIVNDSLQPHLVDASFRITVRLLGLPSAAAIGSGALCKLLRVHLAVRSLMAAHHEAARRHVPGPVAHLGVHHHAGAPLAAEHASHHLVDVPKHGPHHGIHLLKRISSPKRLHTEVVKRCTAHGHHLTVVPNTSRSTRRPPRRLAVRGDHGTATNHRAARLES
mmetsp:Transcript_19729/g.47908  ORF Transcript_19729/g.47908 Transcript_19729/m.47908 type:complete len:253 (+) Transcript_19729:264-1022(+)